MTQPTASPTLDTLFKRILARQPDALALVDPPNKQRVTGQPPKAIGAVLPYSYTANDTCHLWKAGIPCLLYGPGVIRGNADEDDSCVLISDMVKVTKVLALTALDVCNRDCV